MAVLSEWEEWCTPSLLSVTTTQANHDNQCCMRTEAVRKDLSEEAFSFTAVRGLAGWVGMLRGAQIWEKLCENVLISYYYYIIA